jgi:aminoglycoside phosphotransferase (APT) family kinase protein
MPRKPPSPQATLRQGKRLTARIVEHHFGSRPKRIVHQASGMSNLVFTVQHSQGDLVVRLCPDQTRLNSYLKEQWAINKARKAGVPTPEVLEVGNQVVPIPYMVSRKTAGHPATHHPQRMRIIREMGRYAAIINSLKTKGFGSTFEWSHNQLSHNATWSEFLHSELKLVEKIGVLVEAGMVPAPLGKKIRGILVNAATETRKPALNHGDMRLKNVLVNDAGDIVAVLDWETCTSNLAPEWEMSLALHDLSIDEKREFIEGYGLSGKKLLEISPVMKAINLVNYAPEVERWVKAKDAAQLDHNRIRLSGALDLYSL